MEGQNKTRRRLTVGLRLRIVFAAEFREAGHEEMANLMSAHWYTYTCERTCTVSSKAGLYLKVAWPGRPPAEMPAIHWEETPSMLVAADSCVNTVHNSARKAERAEKSP